VKFVDGILHRFLDLSGQERLLDEAAAESLASAAYYTDRMALGGPFTIAVERVEPGVMVEERVEGEAQSLLAGSMQTSSTRFQLQGLSLGQPMIVDLLWHGAVIGNLNESSGRVAAVEGTLTDKAEPPLTLVIERTAPDASSPVSLPITAAILIDRSPAGDQQSISELIAIARRLRRAAVQSGLIPSPPSGLPRKPDLPVIIVIPDQRLQDSRWPGAAPGDAPDTARAKQLARANSWASQSGIVFITAEAD
jgi:hypothetical protein